MKKYILVLGISIITIILLIIIYYSISFPCSIDRCPKSFCKLEETGGVTEDGIFWDGATCVKK